jgi:hypothetical protein
MLLVSKPQFVKSEKLVSLATDSLVNYEVHIVNLFLSLIVHIVRYPTSVLQTHICFGINLKFSLVTGGALS